MDKSSKKIVVMGGGTGTYVTLTALHHPGYGLEAVVRVADSGGSTGRLRDEFGFLPVGDLRQALAAMARGKNQDWIQKLLLYRFSKGSSLEGHNLGNLILTALQDLCDNTAQALDVAASIFRLHGAVYPITSKDIQLVIEYTDGTIEIGEHIMDEAKHSGKKVKRIKTSPKATIHPPARNALLEADAIILSPGDLYASLMANLVVGGAAKAIRESQGKLVYVLNLMTRRSQTHGLTARDHVAVIEKQIGRPLDVIIVNNQPIPDSVMERYAQFEEFPVEDDLGSDERVIRANLIRETLVEKAASDVLPRSFLRHDPEKLSALFSRML
jgi:uncharacterized cofD-like protein